MLVNITHDTRREHLRLLVTGVVFLLVLAFLIWLSIAIYTKAFVTSTTVTLKADRAGLQLAKFGDVRQHGVLVGRVDSVEQDGEQASIRLALEPEAARKIPANAAVEILPTTLFGQKFVSFVDPDRPASRSLADGDVIPSSRVRTNVEIQKILADLFPLLRSIRPADLNTTLTSIASALSGRGDQLGRTLTELDAYLTRINKELPVVEDDLRLLRKVSRTYSLATPDLVRLLRNATTTARTVTKMEEQVEGFFTGLSTLAVDSRRVLARNEESIVQEGDLAVPLLRLLDTYSPGFPCLIKGTARYTDRLNEIFENGEVNQTMSLNAVQKPPYGPDDAPEYGDIGRGPHCLGLPEPEQPFPGIDLANGSDTDQQGPPLP